MQPVNNIFKREKEWEPAAIEIYCDSKGKHKCADCFYGHKMFLKGYDLAETTLSGTNGCEKAEDWIAPDGAKLEDNGGGHWIVYCPGFCRIYPSTYTAYLKTEKWQKKRFERNKLDGFRCQMCGTAKNLNVHHLTYENLGRESIYDLVTLCESCHKKVHEKDLAQKEGAE